MRSELLVRSNIYPGLDGFAGSPSRPSFLAGVPRADLPIRFCKANNPFRWLMSLVRFPPLSGFAAAAIANAVKTP